MRSMAKHIAPRWRTNKETIEDIVILCFFALAAVLMYNLWTYNSAYAQIAGEQRLFSSNKQFLDALPYQVGGDVQLGADNNALARSEEAVIRFSTAGKQLRAWRPTYWHGNLLNTRNQLIAGNQAALRKALAFRASARRRNSFRALYFELRATKQWENEASRAGEMAAAELERAGPYRPPKLF